MKDIDNFVEEQYGYRPAELWTVEQFNDWKLENGHEADWDYPLEEYDVIAEHKKEDGIEYEAVRFSDGSVGYDYRFCEIHKE